MFNEMLTRINEWLNGPMNEALRKSPEMAAAHTEAQILKAEEDFEAPPIRLKSSFRRSVRLVPRHDDHPSIFKEQSHSHGRLWHSSMDSPLLREAKEAEKKRE